MERSTRLLLAGGLVVTTVIPYVGYAIAGEMPFVEDSPRHGIHRSGVGCRSLVHPWHSCLRYPLARHRRRRGWLAALGVVAAVLETGTASSVFLAAFMAVIVAMYLIAVYEYLHDTGRWVHRDMTAGHV